MAYDSSLVCHGDEILYTATTMLYLYYFGKNVVFWTLIKFSFVSVLYCRWKKLIFRRRRLKKESRFRRQASNASSLSLLVSLFFLNTKLTVYVVSLWQTVVEHSLLALLELSLLSLLDFCLFTSVGGDRSGHFYFILFIPCVLQL
jgi:hypothetical protein